MKQRGIVSQIHRNPATQFSPFAEAMGPVLDQNRSGGEKVGTRWQASLPPMGALLSGRDELHLVRDQTKELARRADRDESSSATSGFFLPWALELFCPLIRGRNRHCPSWELCNAKLRHNGHKPARGEGGGTMDYSVNSSGNVSGLTGYVSPLALYYKAKNSK